MIEKYEIANFSGLLSILEDDAKRKMEPNILYNRLFIRGENSKVDIMLRLDDPEVFTIARFEVENKRIGVGNKILEWCINFAKKEKFIYIEVESVHTESMKSFCIKHNFEQEHYCNSTNWKKKI